MNIIAALGDFFDKERNTFFQDEDTEEDGRNEKRTAMVRSQMIIGERITQRKLQRRLLLFLH